MTPNRNVLRKANASDVGLLVNLMAEFYSDSSYRLNPRRATDAFGSLLSDERLGYVWIIQSGTKDVGYVVLTLCYGMTFGGLGAIVDDFFVQKAFRGAGLGKAALAQVKSFCLEQGFRFINVETGHDNLVALAVYRGAGFAEAGHVHLTLPLAEPTHAP